MFYTKACLNILLNVICEVPPRVLYIPHPGCYHNSGERRHRYHPEQCRCDDKGNESCDHNAVISNPHKLGNKSRTGGSGGDGCRRFRATDVHDFKKDLQDVTFLTEGDACRVSVHQLRHQHTSSH